LRLTKTVPGRYSRILAATIASVMIQPQSLLKNRYRVGRRLGDGGMAIVYLGHDLLLGRDVAIKTLRPQYAADPAFRVRFEREARAAASLSHPNIIDVHDVGEDGGLPYLIMELVRGQSLKEIIAAEAPFHADDVAELLEQIGGALDYAHARGLVHRDVKPGNILIDAHGRARVVDFGIAKGLADVDLTEAGSGFGTVGYLSPEQAEGLMATPASDVYSAGVVAFEMLTGQLPFSAETPIGLAMRHVNDRPPAPSSIARSVPAPIDAIVLRALDKDPTRRWGSVGGFAQAMRRWRDHVPPETPLPAVTAPESPARGSLLPTIVVAVLVLGALAVLLWTGLRREDAPVDEAPRTVIVPPAPVITGALDADEPAPSELAPTTALSEATATATVAAQAAPTIAPAVRAAISVPNVQGLTIASATQALLPLGLRIALGRPVFSDSIPLNAVAAQDPPPGAPATAGDVVRVSLSRGPSPFVERGEP
jgi:eukaryotic-like serine/threonine-protein kinase